MSEWCDSQKKPIVDFRKFLQERLDKTNPRRTLTAEEERRLSKLEAIADKLKRNPVKINTICVSKKTDVICM